MHIKMRKKEWFRTHLTPAACLNSGHPPQEDAHEFLVFLLKQLEEEFLNDYGAEGIDYISQLTNPLTRIFGGWELTECTCSSFNCGFVSQTYSPFTNLQLIIRDENSNNRKQSKVHSTPNTLILQLQRFQPDGSKLSSEIDINEMIYIGK
ncbi:ubiquitin carboxyl-terminal hydrolase 36-like [Frankliniella occidentalis]|uniref:Ubiquitin carboxyl-terminal hydrolase 36 n=1 Tax=Frankliniella occidentalis TaxID=133901 RepID=A0A9C6XTV1_FRAOC|nr:ubiquitin carboxyl-terminal hydrolase 36-like [Frankliniella occidentalis]